MLCVMILSDKQKCIRSLTSSSSDLSSSGLEGGITQARDPPQPRAGILSIFVVPSMTGNHGSRFAQNISLCGTQSHPSLSSIDPVPTTMPPGLAEFSAKIGVPQLEQKMRFMTEPYVVSLSSYVFREDSPLVILTFYKGQLSIKAVLS